MGFPEKLRALRIERGWSQGNLSKKTGVTNLMISKYETGRCNPPLEKLALLARVLGVTADYLISDDVPRNGRIEVKDVDLFERLQQAQDLSEANRLVLRQVIEALIAREQADHFAEERTRHRTSETDRPGQQPA